MSNAFHRAETRHGTDVEDANVGLKSVLVIRVDILILLVQAEDGLHWDNSFLLAFDLVRQGDGNGRGRETVEKTCVVRHTLGSVLIYTCRHMLPVGTLVMMAS
jgi:hypothetical protein